MTGRPGALVGVGAALLVGSAIFFTLDRRLAKRRAAAAASVAPSGRSAAPQVVGVGAAEPGRLHR